MTISNVEDLLEALEAILFEYPDIDGTVPIVLANGHGVSLEYSKTGEDLPSEAGDFKETGVVVVS